MTRAPERLPPTAVQPAAAPAVDPLYDLVEELTRRMQRGEAVELEEVVAEHPQHAERLREVFPTLALLAEIGVGESGAKGFSPGASGTGAPLLGALGDFRIEREIGRGGMGIVYEARQISLDRRVALKVLPLAGMLDARHLQRFKNEARAAAGLHHANIVPVYAVGCERGIHYYAMQFIEGCTLAQVIRGVDVPSRNENRSEDISGLGLGAGDVGMRSTSVLGAFSTQAEEATASGETERCRLIAEWGGQIAEGLEYAHSVGVIHRDIKPANLLLDASGRIWITDFGLAQLETDAGLTMTGDVIGTLRYMSPEQALGERGLVDQRSDIYSLGLTLYELLTRTPAFGQVDRRELLQRIANEDPPAVRRWAPEIPVDLETIVHKAIEKDPAARYRTARELAEDLRRFLRELPVRARPATRADRIRKWSRRNRSLVRLASAFGVVASLAIGAAAIVIDHERQQSRLERLTMETEKDRAAAAHENLRVHQYVTSINLAERAWRQGLFDEGRRLLRECIPPAGAIDLRGFEWQFLWRETRQPAPAIGNHHGRTYCAAVSPDRRMLATGGEDGVRVWDLDTVREIKHLYDYKADVNGVAFSPDGRWLATASEDPDVRIWKTADWQLEQKMPYPGEVVAVAFSMDGRTLVVGERNEIDPSGHKRDGSLVTLMDTTTWEARVPLRIHTGQLQTIAISDDGALLATGGDDQTVCLWEMETGAFRQRLLNGTSVEGAEGVKCVAFAHRRPLIAVAGHRGLVRLWRTDTFEMVATAKAEPTELDAVAFSRNDAYLVVGGRQETMQVWRLEADDVLVRQRDVPVTSQVWSATFLDDDTLIVTQADGAVRRWSAARPPGRRIVYSSTTERPDFEFATHGRDLVVAASTVEVHSMDGRGARRTIPWDGPKITGIAAAADGESHFVMMDGEAWRVTGLEAGKPKRTMLVDSRDRRNPVTGLRCLGRDRPLSVRHLNDAIPEYVDPLTGAFVPSPVVGEKPLDGLSTAANSPISAVIRANGRIEILNGPQLVRTIDGRGPIWKTVVISPDGHWMAASQNDGTIHIWDLRSPDSELVFLVDSKPPLTLEFSVDGKTLVACTQDRRIRLWNVATGREMLTLETDLQTLHRVTLSPAGQALAASGLGISGEFQVMVWLADLESATSGDGRPKEDAAGRSIE